GTRLDPTVAVALKTPRAMFTCDVNRSHSEGDAMRQNAMLPHGASRWTIAHAVLLSCASCIDIPEVAQGKTEPTVLASNQTNVTSLAMDDTHLVWTNDVPGGGAVMRCAKTGCGGVPTELATGEASPSLAVIAPKFGILWVNMGTGELRCALFAGDGG